MIWAGQRVIELLTDTSTLRVTNHSTKGVAESGTSRFDSHRLLTSTFTHRISYCAFHHCIYDRMAVTVPSKFEGQTMLRTLLMCESISQSTGFGLQKRRSCFSWFCFLQSVFLTAIRFPGLEDWINGQKYCCRKFSSGPEIRIWNTNAAMSVKNPEKTNRLPCNSEYYVGGRRRKVKRWIRFEICLSMWLTAWYIPASKGIREVMKSYRMQK